MGGKQSKGGEQAPKGLVHSNSLLRLKRRKSASNMNLNRSSSSPVIAKWRMSGSFVSTQQNSPVINNTGINETIRPPTLPVSSQQRPLTLCEAVKQTQPSFHQSSKLYRPSSFLAAKANDLPTTFGSEAPPVVKRPGGVKQPPQSAPSSQQQQAPPPSKTPVTSKIAKRLGLSPRFKRKIVETIANKVSNHSESGSNHKLTTVNQISSINTGKSFFLTYSKNPIKINK